MRFNLISLKVLYRKLQILPAFIIFTYLCLISEAIKYPGFIGKYLIIDVKAYFAVVIILLLFTDTKSKITDFILKANRIFLILLSLIYLCFSLLEGANFTNYVLATFHFHLDGLVVVVLFSLSIFLADKFKGVLPRITGKPGIVYLTLVSLMVFFVVKNITLVFDMAVSRNSYILFHLRSSYDDKMFYEWGDFFRFMVFVRNNTPSDATIVIPPEQDPWLMGSGNDHFVRAFLFPRNIVQEPIIIPDLKSLGSKTYILITWGKEECKPEGCHGWPRQNIFAKKIIYKDPNSSNVIETKVNTVYKLEDTKYVYGVIEL